MRLSSLSRMVAVALTLPLVGGLLLMHGIEAPGASPGAHGAAMAATHMADDHSHSQSRSESHDHAAPAVPVLATGTTAATSGDARVTDPAGTDGGCAACGLMGHGVMLCVAVVGTVLGAGVVRRFGLVLRRLIGVAGVWAGVAAAVAVVAHRVVPPRRPVRVELAVMLC